MAVTAKNGNKAPTNPTTADLTAQIETLQADIKTITQTLGNFGKSKTQDFAASAKSNFATAREKGEEQAEHLKVQATDFMRDQPALTIGIAAGLGFLIGALSRR